MSSIERRTLVVQGKLALQDERCRAARESAHGQQIIYLEHLAARLAGGFTRVVDGETLLDTVQQVLLTTPLGELDGLKTLPGMVQAVVDTISKVWRSGIDLQEVLPRHPRIDTVARIEQAVVDALPRAMKRPSELVRAALERLKHAETVFGPIEIRGALEVAPCWRPLLGALAEHVSVTWDAGPHAPPTWLRSPKIQIRRSSPKTPSISRVSAATTLHEAVEAMRWARQLIVEGMAKPQEIAISAVHVGDYDAHFLALRDQSPLSFHFVHGTSVLASKEGQMVSALADILVRGLSQASVRRLVSLLGSASGPFAMLPVGWLKMLPPDAPMSSVSAWERFYPRLVAEGGARGKEAAKILGKTINLLASGISAAEEAGSTCLNQRPLALWTKALRMGPVTSLERSLEALKQEDGLHPQSSVSWMPVGALAASGRKFVRLLGLNSSRWPRGIAEDSLLADHILPNSVLDSLPVHEADRRDFAAVLASTEHQVVLSRARRDSEGRLLGQSSLLGGLGEEIYLRRHRRPEHPYSEADRLASRPEEFCHLPRAKAVSRAWKSWLRPELTPHDGLVCAKHPALVAALGQVQSAKSLSQLLRNPIAFVWQYALGFREPKDDREPLFLSKADKGILVHSCCERALDLLEQGKGLCSSSLSQRENAVQASMQEVSAKWEAEHGVPPQAIWDQLTTEVRELSLNAISFEANTPPNGKSWAEVPFGGAKSAKTGAGPWDGTRQVCIPGTQLLIQGYIDRLSLAPDGKVALVSDYKTGRRPKREEIILYGGRELQRCLYAFATQALLGAEVNVHASIVYAQNAEGLTLEQPHQVLQSLTGHLEQACERLLAAGGIPGEDAGSEYDDTLFMLPANAAAIYCRRKAAAAKQHLGPAADIWEAP